jgi:hypothetical protein
MQKRRYTLGLIFSITVVMTFIISDIQAQLHRQDDPDKMTKPAKNQKSFWDRVYFGGYLGLQFGTVTFIDIAPLATYQVTEDFYVGLGPTYQYISDKRYDPHYNTSSYGAQFYARYFIWKDLFAQVEYDPLYLTYYDYNFTPLRKSSVWVNDLMLGGGYRQWLGDRAFATIIILFNVNESIYSPYQNPVIRIGFGIGL